MAAGDKLRLILGGSQTVSQRSRCRDDDNCYKGEPGTFHGIAYTRHGGHWMVCWAAEIRKYVRLLRAGFLPSFSRWWWSCVSLMLSEWEWGTCQLDSIYITSCGRAAPRTNCQGLFGVLLSLLLLLLLLSVSPFHESDMVCCCCWGWQL